MVDRSGVIVDRSDESGPSSRDANLELYERALQVIPGGVNSPVRAFQAVGGSPYFVSRAEGAYVWDANGRPLIDFVQSYGASILGHAHPDVVEVIRTVAATGTTYGAPTELEVQLAEEITSRVPGCEQVRMTSSGTEASMSAIRVARAFTGRHRVVKFAGCYHGHADSLLAAGGSGVATLGLPDSAGVPPGAVGDTIVVPYNSVPEVGDDVACVIVEPIAANMGLVPPVAGFLEGLRGACDSAGALLVFDEVITGFRVHLSGASGMLGVRPDLWCFGKVIGGGLPVGAFGGRREVMDVLAPSGPVYQAGTLAGNPLAMAAGLEVLRHLDEQAYDVLEKRATELAAGLAEAFGRAGVPVTTPVAGALVGLFFSDAPVLDYEGARRAVAGGHYAAFFHEMLSRGIAFAPGPYEAIFPSLAHGESELASTVDAASRSLERLLKTRGAPTAR